MTDPLVSLQQERVRTERALALLEKVEGELAQARALLEGKSLPVTDEVARELVATLRRTTPGITLEELEKRAKRQLREDGYQLRGAGGRIRAALSQNGVHPTT